MQTSERNIIPAGYRRGRLTVVSTDHYYNGIYYYKCKCDCGNEVVINKYSLTRKTRICTNSCGCIRRERMREQAIARHHGQK